MGVLPYTDVNDKNNSVLLYKLLLLKSQKSAKHVSNRIFNRKLHTKKNSNCFLIINLKWYSNINKLHLTHKWSMQEQNYKSFMK